MRSFVRRHLGTMVVAMVTAAVTAAAPSLAGTVVKFAKNAGKVDNLNASQLVAAGAHTVRPTEFAEPVIDDFFNYVNEAEPVISGADGTYDIDFGFSMANRFVLCSLDTNFVDTRDALCTVSRLSGNSVRVRIWDTGTLQGPAQTRNGEFFVLVLGS